MKKIIITLAVVILMLGGATRAFAKVDLEALHGKDLKNADFVIRYKFQQVLHISWEKASVGDRRWFLEQWYKEQDRIRKIKTQQQRDARAKAMQERLDESKKRITELQMIRAKRALTKQEEKEEEDKKKEFDDLVKKRIRTIQDLRVEQEMKKQKDK